MIHSFRRIIALAPLAVTTLSLPGIAQTHVSDDVLSPSNAVAVIDSHRGNLGVIAVFAMTVVAVGQDRENVYLNSSADYRPADDLTFRLKPSVARQLFSHLRIASRQQLVGRHIVVRGIGKAVPIVKVERGHPARFVRYQHMVVVDQFEQIAID